MKTWTDTKFRLGSHFSFEKLHGFVFAITIDLDDGVTYSLSLWDETKQEMRRHTMSEQELEYISKSS